MHPQINGVTPHQRFFTIYNLRYPVPAMMLRIFAGLAALALCTVLLWWAHGTREPPWRIANGMAGQHWYRLTLNNEHIGYLASRTEASANGSWTFHSDLRFAMSENSAVQIRQELRFAPRPPYALQSARYRLHRDDNRVEIDMSALPQPTQRASDHPSSGAPELVADQQPKTYQLRIVNNGVRSTKEVAWAYRLQDYLAFEVWLQTQKPNPKARLTVQNIDFERLALVPKVMELTQHTDNGYQVSNAAPQADSVIDLGLNFVPRRLVLAGLFDLQLTDRSSALAPRGKLLQASYRVALDRQLPDHQNLIRLTLQPQPVGNDTWPDTLSLRANSISDTRPPSATELLATPEFPADNPRLQTLLEELNLHQDPNRQVDQLLSFVHSFLRYNDNAQSIPVLELLRHREGDCTEFADLFTSLARAAQLPARTVYGLAYTDSPTPALTFHAWNEVYLENRWESVDPTWNQRPTDATHWLLPTNERAALNLLTGRSNLSFSVIDKAYQNTGYLD